MRYLFLFIFFNLFFQTFGQVEIEKIINIEADNIYSDNFDNLYVLSENVFIKYNKEGKKTASFFPETGEEITGADVRNPFKIILFFSNRNKIILLDNKLIQISEDLYLDKVDVFGDALISGATIGGFWIYDKINSQLLKLKPNFSIEYKKDMNFSEEIISITDNASNVLFQKSTREYISYNINNGNIENLLIYKTSDSYRFINNEIVFYSGNIHGLSFYNWNTGKYRYIKFPSNITVTNAVYGKTKAFFFDKSKVYISTIKEN